MKRKLFLTVMMVAVSILAFAQGNSGLGFNYQAVVRGVDGFVLPSKSIELRFSLLPGQQATEPSWVETHNVTTDALGTIGVTVGKGAKAGGVAATYADVNFAAVYYWMRVEIKENSSYRELSFSALPSMPYVEVAFNAAMMPAGTVVSFMGAEDNIPQGWLLCDGREVSRSEYANLYAAIGTVWGFGNNATTFNLPDLRGVFERGVSGDSGKDPDAASRMPWKEGGNSGNDVGTYQGDAIRNITGSAIICQAHPDIASGALTLGWPNLGNGGDASDGSANATLYFDASRVVPTAAENRPINVYVYKIIKF